MIWVPCGGDASVMSERSLAGAGSGPAAAPAAVMAALGLRWAFGWLMSSLMRSTAGRLRRGLSLLTSATTQPVAILFTSGS